TVSQHVSVGIMSPSWVVDDLLQFSDYESSDKGQLAFNELERLSDMNLFGEHILGEALAASEVPQLPFTQASHNMPSHKQPKLYSAHKKSRLEIQEEDNEEFFTVLDLG
ncbi:salt-tolerance protein, partial [Striga asiatica]